MRTGISMTRHFTYILVIIVLLFTSDCSIFYPPLPPAPAKEHRIADYSNKDYRHCEETAPIVRDIEQYFNNETSSTIRLTEENKVRRNNSTCSFLKSYYNNCGGEKNKPDMCNRE